MLSDKTLKYAIKRIHFKARQLLGKYGFTQSDFDDLRQELLLYVLKQMPKFDGDRADVRVFITSVVDRRIANIIDEQEAECRDYRRVERSLDDWVPDDGDGGEGETWTTRGKTITEDEARAHLCQARRSRQELAELGMDISKVLDRLSPRDRQLCLLLKEHNVSEVSRRIGLSRWSVHQRIKAIRQAFVDAAIRDYL